MRVQLFDDPMTAEMVLGGTWRLAKSLEVLRAEIDALAPDRSRVLDGTIGDAAHSVRVSRHNPYQGVVCALDLTHDPEHGLDCGWLFEYLRTHPHPNLEYIIHNRQVTRRRTGWKIDRYTGSHDHAGHIHIAVGHGTDGAPFVSLTEVDNVTPWLEGGEDLNEMQDELLKQNRLSNVARSYDVAMIDALIQGDLDRYQALQEQKRGALEQERVRLGLTKAQAGMV